MDLFGTAGVRGDVVERVTPELALAVGRAVGLEAAARTGAERPTFVLGRDGRTTGPGLAAAVEAGLTSAGASVTRIGVVPTPTVAFASRGRHGVMLTASHNPPTDNGIKCFADGVEYDHEMEAGVERRVEADPAPVAWDRWGETDRADPLPAYRRAVAEYAASHGAPADGLRVVVDCGNGVGAVATPEVLSDLDVDVVTLNATVDGHFPGRPSKPTPESLADLRAVVADDDDAAFGVGHDGDADRLAVVDASGEVIHEDTITAILAGYVVANTDAADPVVVTTPNSSGRIDERVEAADGRVERVSLGSLHEGIRDVRAAGGDVVYAAEPWKHLHPELGGWIDGVASVALLARVVAEAAEATGEGAGGAGLDRLREPVTERPYVKTNVDCPEATKPDAMADLATDLPDAFPEAAAEVDAADGVRLDFGDGSWLLVRPSGTEPYIRLYAESDDVDALLEEATPIVEAAVDRN
jgi:phosphomannomutase